LFITKNFENYHTGTKSYSYEITNYELDRILIEYEGFISLSQEHTSQKVNDKEVRYVNKPFYEFKTPQMHIGKVAVYLNMRHQIINGISEKKLRALYQFLKKDEMEVYEWWKDEKFEAELNRRAEALENGTDKGETLEEFKEHYRLKFLENSDK
jgi:hypothetical protein